MIHLAWIITGKRYLKNGGVPCMDRNKEAYLKSDDTPCVDCNGEVYLKNGDTSCMDRNEESIRKAMIRLHG